MIKEVIAKEVIVIHPSWMLLFLLCYVFSFYVYTKTDSIFKSALVLAACMTSTAYSIYLYYDFFWKGITMKTLVNKKELSLFIKGEMKMLDVPVGSKFEHIKTTTNLMAYYEMFTYNIECNLTLEKEEKIPINIRCSKYVGGKHPKVDCIKGNLHKQDRFYWPDVFDEDFPEWVLKLIGC